MKPIIMGAEDVRAIMDNRKTMFRQVMKPQPTYWDDGERLYDKHNIVGPEFYNPIRVGKDGEEYPGEEVYGIYSDNGEYGCESPYKPGDILWVREKWRTVDYEYHDCKWSASIEYADGSKGLRVFWYDNTDLGIPDDCIYSKIGWRPSIHMPREAARLFLRVTDVRVERVQDILCGDMKREGAIPKAVTGGQYQQWQNDYFKPAWDARNAKRGFGWDTNCWVWAITFERRDC